MDAVLKTLANRVLAAVADGTTLCIRGGGTKDFYGETPEGEVLDTRQLTGITSYEPSELVVTVRAGTPLDELEAALAESGQCLAFEPPRFASGGTVGGMLSAGLSGPSRASVGAVRDYVLGVELLDGRAELLRFGGTVMKNVAGYDISRLLAGALGTLGVVTEVSLKVLPIATTEATLDFDCTQADALRLLNAWGGKSLPLNASLWRERGGTRCALGALPRLSKRPAATSAESASSPSAPQPSGSRYATSNIRGSPRCEMRGSRSGVYLCRRPHLRSCSMARCPGSNGMAASAGTGARWGSPTG